MTIAYWSCSLDTECPKCGNYFDILDLPDYQEYIWGVEPCESDAELDIFCPECEHKFIVKTAY